MLYRVGREETLCTSQKRIDRNLRCAAANRITIGAGEKCAFPLLNNVWRKRSELDRMNTLEPALITAAAVIILFATAVYCETVGDDFSQRDRIAFERLRLEIRDCFQLIEKIANSRSVARQRYALRLPLG